MVMIVIMVAFGDDGLDDDLDDVDVQKNNVGGRGSTICFPDAGQGRQRSELIMIMIVMMMIMKILMIMIVMMMIMSIFMIMIVMMILAIFIIS